MTISVSMTVIDRPASSGPEAPDGDFGVEQLHAARRPGSGDPGPADHGLSLNQTRLRSLRPYLSRMALTVPLLRSSPSATL